MPCVLDGLGVCWLMAQDTLSTVLFTFASMALLGVLAVLLDAALLFPSLGPTAFCIAAQPSEVTSCPRNAVVGHIIGLVCGLVSLGTVGVVETYAVGFGAGRVVAASLSLAATSGAMIATQRVHPPACATTLIVSLGVAATPAAWGSIPLAVVLLCLLGWGVSRARGGSYPAWGPVA